MPKNQIHHYAMRYTPGIAALTLAVLLTAIPRADAAPYHTFAAPQQGIPLERIIEGRVIDAADESPLPGVNIVVLGTTIGTTSGVDGRYSLEIPDDVTQDTLRYSFVGYETATIPISGRSVINVRLQPSVLMGDELVVVGYGVQRRSDVTGSVSSINPTELTHGLNSTMDELIKGRVAGVRVVQNSGEPGGGSSISIRGASSISAGTGPLYVIDGVPVDNVNATGPGTGVGFVGSRSPRDPLSQINPSDIESIEILKDASATAIYGSRGANGVILVSTKSGRAGDLRIGYDGYVGVQQSANRLDLLTPTEYQQVINGLLDAGYVGANEEERVTEMASTTNWQESLTADNPVVHSHNFSFNGGAGPSKYYVSLGAFAQDGLITSSAFERYTGRFNLNHDATDKFRLALNLSTSYTKDDYVPVGFGLNENAGALYAAYNYDPTISIRNGDGTFRRSEFMNIDNPLAIALGSESLSETYRTYGSVSGEYSFTNALSAKLLVGGDATNSRRDTYVSRQTLLGGANGGIATVLNGEQDNYLVELTGNFNKTLGAHRLNALLGTTAQRFETRRTNSTGRGYPSDVLGTDALGRGDPTNFEIGSVRFANQLLSYISRVNYTLRDRYLMTGTVRVDGSSRFGENNKYGVFPSFALGWRMDQESFMDGSEWVNLLKPRVSWGRTGNQAIGNYNSLLLFSGGPTVAFNDQPVSTFNGGNALANADLKWETTEQFDVGLDFGLFRDRISGTIDYFIKDTYDLLINLPVPTETGFDFRLTNVGSVRNSGFEFGVVSHNVDGPFSWKSDANLTMLKNEVEDIGALPEIVTGNAGFTSQIAIIRKGLPLNSYYGYEIEGIWQEGDDFSATSDNVAPGDLKFRDVDGDGSVTADDRVVLGNSFPDLAWGFGNTFSFKNVELYVFFEGVHGVDMLNNNLVDTYFPVNLRRNKFAEPYLNRWTPENPSNVYPSFVNPLGQGQKIVNSYTVQDASYIRLQSVRLSYSVPPQISPVRALTVYVTADNLVTWSDYVGIDPAVNPNGDANFRIDYNGYPLSRRYTLGLRLGL